MRNLLRTGMVGIIIALLALSSAAKANDKGEQLRRTMAEIALLNGQMAQRRADAAGIRDELSSRLETIRTEALQVLREKNIKTQADALDQPRLLYNMLLIGEIEAYIERYTEKIGFYRVACDRLSYLYQQADDELKIVSTLSDLKIDALVSQADKILDGYLSDAQTLVIQPATLAPEAPEKIFTKFKALK